MSSVDALVKATGDSIRHEVLPVDDTYDGDVTAVGADELRTALQAKAR